MKRRKNLKGKTNNYCFLRVIAKYEFDIIKLKNSVNPCLLALGRQSKFQT